jgi:ectoine hydroxylase-related dioxygenase (phytanoyl-CoA dioxygenase family)
MSGRLTAAQRRAYRQDGLIFPVPILSAAEGQRYRAACDELEARLGGKPRTVAVRQMHLHFPWAHALATHPAILDAASDLLGPDLLIWATELFAKHPHDATVSVGWHRDQPYLGFHGGHSTTAWVALSDSTAANGCMRVLPRSAERPSLSAATPACAPQRQAPTPETEPYLVDVTLRPGEMSLHAEDVLHGSAVNPSREKRVGFVIRFVTPEARPVHGRPSALLARGSDPHHHFALAEPPGPASEAQALAGLRSSACQHLDSVLENLKQAGVRS